MFWKTYKIEEDRLYSGSIGPLALWIKKERGDWYLATQRQEGDNPETHELALETEPAAAEADEPAWSRWVINSQSCNVKLQPVMPNRPLIVRPEIPIKIPAGQHGTFYINIPLWLRLEVGSKKPVLLCEVPISVMVNSWFGDLVAGELCYSKKSQVRQHFMQLDPQPCNAVCTVSIYNNSKAELDFTRFCLSVENLSVFKSAERLWTNPVRVTFQGEDQLSQIHISRHPPQQAGQISLLTPARKEIDNSFIKKSFQFFRNLTGF